MTPAKKAAMPAVNQKYTVVAIAKKQ